MTRKGYYRDASKYMINWKTSRMYVVASLLNTVEIKHIAAKNP